MRLPEFGGVPEWLKGSDCKSDGSAFGGSNPPPSTIFGYVSRKVDEKSQVINWAGVV